MPFGTKALYTFGKYRCDSRERLLLRDGAPVPITPKCFDILVFLLQSEGRLLTKDEIMRRVWPDSFVEEANLTVNISALRRTLGDTGDGERYIETVPKSGYRFVAPVVDEPDVEAQKRLTPAGASKPSEPQSRRESVGSSRSHWAWKVLAVVVVVTAVLLFISLRRPRLSNKDTVVLADFLNTTGDPLFDGALRQGLSSQLEQSPYLNLLSDDRIAQTLTLMAQAKDSRLTSRLAMEVCQRTGSAAVLDPSISQVGTQYLLTLKALNCSNGESLGSAEVAAADKDHVLDAMGTVASTIRNRLGESLSSVQKYDAPAENVTTPSLEALKAYSLGYRALVLQADYTTAIPLFQRAVSLDPNFAMAYARLGTSYFNVYETVEAAKFARKAFELKDRVSEREKLYIASHYELIVTGNLEAARKIYELSAQTYPRDIPLNNLGVIYSELGEFDKALNAFQQVLSLSAGTGNRYANLINGYLQLDRLEEAKAAGREAKSRKIDSTELHLSLYWLAFLERDFARMDAEVAEMISKPGHQDKVFNYQADTALYFGNLDQARQLTRAAVDSAQKTGHKEAEALYKVNAALREALVGNFEAAKQNARAALTLSDGRDVVALAAISLKLAGDDTDESRLVGELGRRFPEDTLVQFTYLPALRALKSIGAKGPESGVAAPVANDTYGFGGNLETVNFVFYTIYFRGLAYLSANQGSAAASEFQEIIKHPGALRSEPIGALSHLQLGRAFKLSGEKDKARAAYRDFFAIWKAPDIETPIFKQAKAEYAALN